MTAVTENMQLHIANVLEHDLGSVESDRAVVTSPQQQGRRGDLVQVTPQRIHAMSFGERGVIPVVELDVARIERGFIAGSHHIRTELLVIEHHGSDEVRHLLLRWTAAVVVAEHLLLSLGGRRTEEK